LAEFFFFPILFFNALSVLLTSFLSLLLNVSPPRFSCPSCSLLFIDQTKPSSVSFFLTFNTFWSPSWVHCLLMTLPLLLLTFRPEAFFYPATQLNTDLSFFTYSPLVNVPLPPPQSSFFTFLTYSVCPKRFPLTFFFHQLVYTLCPMLLNFSSPSFCLPHTASFQAPSRMSFPKSRQCCPVFFSILSR